VQRERPLNPDPERDLPNRERLADPTTRTAKHDALERAVRGLVRSAWLLDLAGDRGNGAKVREEYARFAESIELLKRLFPPFESPK